MSQATWKIDWNEDLVLGIPEIDAEHRQFVELVNDLNAAIVRRAGKAEVRGQLDLLHADALAHFKHEEELFARHGYALREEHAGLHRQIEAALSGELTAFAASDFDAEWLERGLRIKALLVDHLLVEDIKYRDFIKSRTGIAADSPA